METSPKSVLFICQMNMVRSPMAEALLKQLHPEIKTIESCGLNKGEADSLVEAVMGEIGVDMSEHKPQTLDTLENKPFDIVIAFTPSVYSAALAVFEGTNTKILNWPLPDPSMGSLDVRAIMDNYRSLRDIIKARLIRYFGPASTL